MLPDRVSNPGPLTYESGALPIALRGPAGISKIRVERYTEGGNLNIRGNLISALFLVFQDFLRYFNGINSIYVIDIHLQKFTKS